MRPAYEIAQRLMWDNDFRTAFSKDRAGALAAVFPTFAHEAQLFGRFALQSGLEEEGYRRLAGAQRTSSSVFVHSHSLLLCYLGPSFFHKLLAEFFELRTTLAETRSLRILEPFDGYIVAPLIVKLAGEMMPKSQAWVLRVMDYDWAIWQARRVAQGWPALAENPPLASGGALLSFDFDLKSLLREVKRLDACNVAVEYYEERILPGPGEYYVAIYPSDGNVAEAKLDRQSFEDLDAAIKEQRGLETPELCQVLEKIGLIANSSFLCCSREAIDPERLEGSLPALIEPQPH
jgi:hypothetical protein